MIGPTCNVANADNEDTAVVSANYHRQRLVVNINTATAKGELRHSVRECFYFTIQSLLAVGFQFGATYLKTAFHDDRSTFRVSVVDSSQQRAYGDSNLNRTR